jgi:hypothetical protein
VFPRDFLCIGRIDCFLASRREQNHPPKGRNSLDAMPPREGQPAIPCGFGRTGVRTFPDFGSGCVSTLPRVATGHLLLSGRRIRRAFSPGKEPRMVHAPNCMLAHHHSWWPRPARVMQDGMGPREAPVSAWRLVRPRPRMRGFLPDRERTHHTFHAPVVQRLTGYAPVPPLRAAMPSPGGWQDGKPNVPVLSAIVLIPAAWTSHPRSRYSIGRRGRRATMLDGMEPIPHRFGAVFLPASGKCDR